MTKYTSALGDKICEHTATSNIGLRHICKELNVPYSTITSWIYDEDHELHDKYADAKQMQLYHLAEEILEIADDSSNDYMTVVKNGKTKQVLNREAITRSRLRIQARTTLIAKLSPILKIKKKIKYPDDFDDDDNDDDVPVPHDDQHMAEDAAQGQKGGEKEENSAAKKTASSSPKNAIKPATIAPPAPEQGHVVYTRNRTIPRHNSMFSPEDLKALEKHRFDTF